MRREDVDLRGLLATDTPVVEVRATICQFVRSCPPDALEAIRATVTSWASPARIAVPTARARG